MLRYQGGTEMTDNIKPEHYRKGEIDLFESWYRTRPFSEFRAIMESIAERYMKRDKEDRVLDLDKAIYTLERLKEKEIEYAKKNTKTPEEAIVDFGKTLGNVTSELFRNKEDSESIYLLKGFLQHGFKYLARDYDGELRAYEFKPVKFEIHWVAGGGDCVRVSDSGVFPHIQWADEEPTKISELLATYENGGENGK